MVRKIRAKRVLRLCEQGLSGRAVARSLGMSRDSVVLVVKTARDAHVSFADVADMSDDDVYGLLFPGRGVHESVYQQPDYVSVHRELARAGVTLKLLHVVGILACWRWAMTGFVSCIRRMLSPRGLLPGWNVRPAARSRWIGLVPRFRSLTR